MATLVSFSRSLCGRPRAAQALGGEYSVGIGIKRTLAIEPVLIPSEKISFRASRLDTLSGDHPHIASLWPCNDQVPVSTTPVVADVDAAIANVFEAALISGQDPKSNNA